MRLAKTLILVSLTIAAIAAIGPGGASASALCKVDYLTETCIEEGLYEPETTLRLELEPGSSVLFVGAPSLKCTGSEMEGEVEENPGEPVPIAFTGMNFSGCNLAGILSCEFNAMNLPLAGAMETLGENNGTISLTSGGSGNPGGVLSCGGIECEYQTDEEGAELELRGGEPASVIAGEVPLELTSGSESCPKALALSATYQVVEMDEPEGPPLESPALQAGNPAKVTPNPVVWKGAGVQNATFEVFQMGKHSIISQTPNKGAFELIQTCGGTTVEVKDPKVGAKCVAQIRVLLGNYAPGETANLLTQWQAEGAKNPQNINTPLELK